MASDLSTLIQDGICSTLTGLLAKDTQIILPLHPRTKQKLTNIPIVVKKLPIIRYGL